MHADPILLIRGLPGSGKTTTSALLRDRHAPAVRISNDSVRSLAMPRDFTAVTIEASEQACFDLALSYREAGFLPVIDGVFMNPDVLAAQQQRVRDAGYTLIVVTLSLNLADLHARNAARSPYEQMDDERITTLHTEFTDWGTTLNIEMNEPEDVAGDVWELVQRQREARCAGAGAGACADSGTTEVLFLRSGNTAAAVRALRGVRRFAPEHAVVVGNDLEELADAHEAAFTAANMRDTLAVLAPLAIRTHTEQLPRDAVSTAAWLQQLTEPASKAATAPRRILVIGDEATHTALLARALSNSVRSSDVAEAFTIDHGHFSLFHLTAATVEIAYVNRSPEDIPAQRSP